MFTGSIFVCTDYEFACNYIDHNVGNRHVLLLGDPDKQTVNRLHGLVAKSLMPSYDATMAYLDNNKQQFAQLYWTHLMSDDSIEFLSIILLSMVQGQEILIYMTEDEYQMYYGIFADYVFKTFGIIIGSPVMQFAFNTTYIPAVITTLYLLDLVGPGELFKFYPQGIPIQDDRVISKLIVDLNPYVKEVSFEYYKDYFNKYKENIKSSGKMLQIIARKVQ